jgi:hypothetical protein
MSTTEQCEACLGTGNCLCCTGTGWLPTGDPDWETECDECGGDGVCMDCREETE